MSKDIFRSLGLFVANAIVNFVTTFGIYDERNERIKREIPQQTITYMNQNQIDINSLEFNRVNGKLFAYLKNDTMIGGLFLRNGWYWEYWMLKYLKHYYIPHTNMIDIGAHIGTSSLLMCDVINTDCTVHAFEPVFYDLCRINIINNNCLNVKLYPFALGSEKGKVNLSLSKDEPSNFGTARVGKTENTGDGTVDVARLDDFNIQNVSVMKIDVEGYELQVLRGGMSTIRRDKPTILIEIHSESLTRYLQSSEFVELFGLGYNLFKIQEGHDDYILVQRR